MLCSAVLHHVTSISFHDFTKTESARLINEAYEHENDDIKDKHTMDRQIQQCLSVRTKTKCTETAITRIEKLHHMQLFEKIIVKIGPLTSKFPGFTLCNDRCLARMKTITTILMMMMMMRMTLTRGLGRGQG